MSELEPGAESKSYREWADVARKLNPADHKVALLTLGVLVVAGIELKKAFQAKDGTLWKADHPIDRVKEDHETVSLFEVGQGAEKAVGLPIKHHVLERTRNMLVFFMRNRFKGYVGEDGLSTPEHVEMFTDVQNVVADQLELRGDEVLTVTIEYPQAPDKSA